MGSGRTRVRAAVDRGAVALSTWTMRSELVLTRGEERSWAGLSGLVDRDSKDEDPEGLMDDNRERGDWSSGGALRGLLAALAASSTSINSCSTSGKNAPEIGADETSCSPIEA